MTHHAYISYDKETEAKHAKKIKDKLHPTVFHHFTKISISKIIWKNLVLSCIFLLLPTANRGTLHCAPRYKRLRPCRTLQVWVDCGNLLYMKVTNKRTETTHMIRAKNVGRSIQILRGAFRLSRFYLRA